VFLKLHTKSLINKEQCKHPPQAARSFAPILKTIEIIQLLNTTEFKNGIYRISTEPFRYIYIADYDIFNNLKNLIRLDSGGVTMKERIQKITGEIDKLVDKTGNEAEKIADSVKSSIKGIAGDIKSIDLREDMNKILEGVDDLSRKTGDGAKHLASDLGEQLDVLTEKINLGRNYDKVNTGLDTLIETTGDEAAHITEDIIDAIKKITASIKSVDVKEDAGEIMDKVKELAQATGKEAEDLASDIKRMVKKLGKKE